MSRLLVVPARDRAAPDKLTLTLSGPQTPDRGRLMKVLAHILGSDSEWDAERPNVDLVAEDVAERQAETSEEISSLAGRGMSDPASLTLDEIERVCASAVSQARRR